MLNKQRPNWVRIIGDSEKAVTGQNRARLGQERAVPTKHGGTELDPVQDDRYLAGQGAKAVSAKQVA